MVSILRAAPLHDVELPVEQSFGAFHLNADALHFDLGEAEYQEQKERGGLLPVKELRAGHRNDRPPDLYCVENR